MKFNVKSLIPHLAAFVVFLGTCMVYFLPQFEGKVLRQGDIIANRGMAQEADAYNEKTGDVALWTNSMFGGMPTYQISSPQKNNYIRKISSAFRLGMNAPAGLFFMGMICFYLAMLLLGISPWVAMVVALSFGLGTVNMINFEAGHSSKVFTVMSAAPMLIGMILVTRGRYIVGGAVFAFFLAMALGFNHLQMIYYLALFCTVYMIAKLVEAVKQNDLANYGKSVGVLVIGALLALGTFSSKFLVTNEYAKDTMRGKPILEQTSTEVKSSSETDGLEWEYAMQYSHNLLDVIAAVIPRAAGGSSAEMISKDSNFAKFVKSRKDTAAPLYFGGLPPTAGVFYLGAILFLLFLLGAVLVRGPMKWWLVGAVVFSFLMSMGKHASFVNWPMFEFLPYFSKFRAPNSVMAVTALLVPILAGLGLHKIFTAEEKSTLIKPVQLTLAIYAGFLLLFALAGPYMVSLEGPSDASYAQYPGMIDALMEDRVSLMRASAFRSLLFVVIAGGAIVVYLRGKLSKYIMLGIIGVLTVIDLSGVSSRYMSKDDFVSSRTYANAFTPRPVDTQILKDKDPHYRVHDLTLDTWNSASGSYFHKMIGGYTAAKLQRIEDVKNRYLIQGNQTVFNMLNTRYFIVPGQDKQPTSQHNPAAMGNAWFVNNIQQVATANEEIDAIGTIDPRLTAVVHQEFASYVEGLTPSSGGTISLTSYSPNKLIYQANATGDQLAVFSEIWYGPNKGWKAYIDGKEVGHIRVNYLLRGLRIPAGNHEVVFEFNPSLYRTGEMLSLISSILILLLCGFAAFRYFKSPKES